MPYAQGRLVHDADAHIMETPTWLRDHAEAAYRDRLPALRYPGGNELRQTGNPEEQQRDLLASFETLRQRHLSDDYRATEAADIMARKNFAATGSFIAEDRPGPRPAGLLQPAHLQHLPQRSAPPPRARGRRRPGLRRRPGPQPGHARVLLGRTPGSWPRSTSRWPTPRRPHP